MSRTFLRKKLGWEYDLNHAIISSLGNCERTWAAYTVQWQESVIVVVLMKTTFAFLEGCRNRKQTFQC